MALHRPDNEAAALGGLLPRMSDTLRPPLFVKPDESLFIFQDPEMARRGIEWQDLEYGSYPGFDTDGRPFGLEAVTEDRKFLRFLAYRRGEVVLTSVGWQRTTRRAFTSTFADLERAFSTGAPSR